MAGGIPLVRSEKPGGIVFDGAAYGGAEHVLTQRRRTTQPSYALDEIGRVERIALAKPERAPVPIILPALADEVNYAARIAPEFGFGLAGQDSVVGEGIRVGELRGRSAEERFVVVHAVDNEIVVTA